MYIATTDLLKEVKLEFVVLQIDILGNIVVVNPESLGLLRVF